MLFNKTSHASLKARTRPARRKGAIICRLHRASPRSGAVTCRS